MANFYKCRCYLWSNYFSSKFKRHFTFSETKEFIGRYYEELQKDGFSEEEIAMCIKNFEKERQRRRRLTADSEERKRLIKEKYKPIHPEIFSLKEHHLHASFVELVNLAKNSPHKDSVYTHVTEMKDKKLFTFPVLSPDFCQEFIEEIEHFEKSDLPKGRPNTMNHYGISLDELGFYENFITPLRENYLNPLCKILLPEWTGSGLDSHKAFVVVYKLGQDIDLATHYDNAEVTLNISLRGNFEEGSLYIGRMRNEERSDTDFVEYVHEPTTGLLHRGEQLHGAMPIEHGERYNMIIWMRSSSVRNKLCPMCDCPPDLEEDSGFGDGFTQTNVNVCSVN